MSKKPFKSQASSSRVSSQSSSAFALPSNPISRGFGSAPSSLSYLAEQPDLSSLTDPNVVVQFKNLAKKDSTTKIKALEELQSYVALLKDKHGEVDDSFLTTWVKVYPRISIDGFRRVRQLAHTVHGQVCLSGGRRVAKHMPKIVGAWLAGSHDTDRAVIRAANEAFDTVFPAAEKRTALTKAYQSSILEFCKDAILNETVQSLSDERTTKAEDAEAKYLRLVSSSVLSLCFLLDQLPATEIHKDIAIYDEIFSTTQLWDFQASKDPNVRRSVFRLLRLCLGKHNEIVDKHIDQIGNILLSKSVMRHQRGTASEYSASLVALTAKYPSLWNRPGRPQSIISRLTNFVQYGSQGASEEYWKNIADLIQALPMEVLPRELTGAVDLLNAIKTGLTRKDEPRSNIEHAWASYIIIANRLSSALSLEDKSHLTSDSLLPILRQYINPAAEYSDWTLRETRPLQTVAKLIQSNEALQKDSAQWSELASRLCEAIKASTSEQLKDIEVAQISISDRGTKWFGLQDHINQNRELDGLNQIVRGESVHVLAIAIQALRASGGEAYGIAQIVQAAMTSLTPWEFQDTVALDISDQFIRSDVPRLIYSRSHLQLISVLYESEKSESFNEAWNLTLQAILRSSDLAEKLALLQELLTWPKTPKHFELPLNSSELQTLLRNEVDRAVNESLDWTFLARLTSAQTPSLARETTDYMLAKIAESLTIESKATAAITGLELLSREGQERLIQSLPNQDNSSLRQNILLLTESEDETLAQRAADLDRHLEQTITKDGGMQTSSRSTLNVLANGWYEADQKSLTIETLVEVGERCIETSQLPKAVSAEKILPDPVKWNDALKSELDAPIFESLAISTQLGAALFLANKAPIEASKSKIQVDKHGFSIPLRIALYTIKIIENASIFDNLVLRIQSEIFRLLLLTMQLVDDNVSMGVSNSLWLTYDLATEDEMLEFISQSKKLFKNWLERVENADDTSELGSPSNFVESTRTNLLEGIVDESPLALRHARAYAYIVSEAIDLHGWKSKFENALEARFRQIRKSNNAFMLMSFIVGYKAPLSNTQAYARTCSEIIADLTGMDIGVSPNECLRQLTLLDLLLEGQEQIIESIAKQRIIFFVKHAISWLESKKAGDEAKTEICRLFQMILPAIRDLYGTHWSSILDFFVNNWSDVGLKDMTVGSKGYLPLVMASLRVISRLQRLMFDGESNEDLNDAWQGSEKHMVNGMVALLERLNVTSDYFNQPLRTVNELLGRIIATFPVELATDGKDLYSLIAIDSTPVQRTAFHIMHKKIPRIQEQVSLDTAIESSAARLPEELLSLVLDRPLQEYMTDASFARNMPTSVQSFLSSWLLVFDHFKNASAKVRNDYTAHLKEGTYLATLLEFICDSLGHSRGRPIDVSKFDITVYGFDIEDSPVRDLQWLLAHLYFLCLKRTPTLAKSWWMECKSRQTVISVESWTEKYVSLFAFETIVAQTKERSQISPHLIIDALTTVNEWAASQDMSSSESVTVKTNPRTKEVVVSKEVDDQVMSMAIRLPDNFPLGQAVLHGVNRVAVDEKKWRSWLLNSQGVITFSNNSLIDGIIAFRRNVVGALKGQTECAICYSIVGADKQLPTKKCGTCNNLFHGSCLYRWFKSSNSSSCPLCRNAFNYS